MKLNPKLLVFMFFLSIINMMQGQTLDGDWSGKLNAMGQEIPLILHISGEDENLEVTMDSPSQGATGIPVDNATFTDGEFKISVMGGQLTYTAQVDGDSMSGNFVQAGMELPLK